MSALPVYGTVPQWGMFITFLAAVLGVWLKFRQQNFDFSAADRKSFKESIAELERKVTECEAREADRIQEIKGLHEELFGLRKQHIQEQISFARAIIQSLGRESPQLSVLLSALENGQRALDAQKEAQKQVHQLTGVTGDTHTEGE